MRALMYLRELESERHVSPSWTGSDFDLYTMEEPEKHSKYPYAILQYLDSFHGQINKAF